MRYGECPGHHRGLRPGHAFTGVAWELGRAICLLVQVTVRNAVISFPAYEAREPRPSCELAEGHKSRRAGKVSGSDSEE